MITVITTISSPTVSVRTLSMRLNETHSPLIVVGDRKGPTSYDLLGSRFLSLEEQIESPFKLGRLLPTGHYSRKNIGYLYAIAQRAECIYETDE